GSGATATAATWRAWRAGEQGRGLARTSTPAVDAEGMQSVCRSDDGVLTGCRARLRRCLDAGLAPTAVIAPGLSFRPKGEISRRDGPGPSGFAVQEVSRGLPMGGWLRPTGFAVEDVSLRSK